MVSNKSAGAAFAVVIGVASWVLVAAGQAPQTNALQLEPTRERGSSISPAYEGWFPNDDGTFTMLFGYFNRNAKQALDIPIGREQSHRARRSGHGPAHLLRDPPAVGRLQRSKCRRISAPRSSRGRSTANGETNAIPFTLNKSYEIEPYKESGMGNTPPTLTFVKGGPSVTGPPIGIAADAERDSVGQPVDVDASGGRTSAVHSKSSTGRGRGAAAPPFTASLHKFRGPGDVTFKPERPTANRETGEVTASATFSLAG